MEYRDAYTRDLKKIEGVTLVRGEAAPDGVYHLVSDIIVRHADGTYLVTQRDPKKHYGGQWEATAGGCAVQGETPLACALRELREETGILCEVLIETGFSVNDEKGILFAEFLCETDWPKDGITLQPGETVAFQWVTREELFSMRRNGLLTQRMHLFLDSMEMNGVL